MFQNLYPDEEYRSSYEIPYESYYQKGFRGILFDVDNTLVEHDQPVTIEAIALFEKLRKIGFEVCIISNNKEPRVKPLADTLGAKYVYKADKPSAKGYVQGMEHMGTTASNTMFVGDQIFTDIYGANKCGIDSILVDFIRLPEEKWFGKRRILEKIILKCCDIQRGGKMGLKNFC